MTIDYATLYAILQVVVPAIMVWLAARWGIRQPVVPPPAPAPAPAPTPAPTPAPNPALPQPGPDLSKLPFDGALLKLLPLLLEILTRRQIYLTAPDEQGKSQTYAVTTAKVEEIKV